MLLRACIFGLITLLSIVHAEPYRVLANSECSECLTSGSFLCRSQDAFLNTAYCCTADEIGVES